MAAPASRLEGVAVPPRERPLAVALREMVAPPARAVTSLPRLAKNAFAFVSAGATLALGWLPASRRGRP